MCPSNAHGRRVADPTLVTIACRGTFGQVSVSTSLWRRQFVMLTTPECPVDGWSTTELTGTYVHAHPDVEVTAAIGVSGNRACLIGFLIDPSDASAQNHDLLLRVADAATPEAIAAVLHGLNGRYALVVDCNAEQYIFHDPCGLRSVFWAIGDAGPVLGSSPTLVASVGGVLAGERGALYSTSEYVATHREHWVPADAVAHDGIRQLTPNHYLRWSDLATVRYWPRTSLPSVGRAEACERAAGILTGVLRAATARKRVRLPLTAGWDSRTLLAASRDVVRDVSLYTLQYRDLTESSPDIAIPLRLTKRLSLDHEVIDCRSSPSADFVESYRRGNVLAHVDDWATIAYGMRDQFPRGTVALKGNGAEVARCFYFASGRHPDFVDVDRLLGFERGWKDLPFVVGRLEDWLAGATTVSEQTGVQLLDLFYWEHRMGGWHAQGALEWDAVQDVLLPFNQRDLFEVLLGAPAADRCAPTYGLFNDLCSTMWGRVLREPVNPSTSAPIGRVARLRASLRLTAKQ